MSFLRTIFALTRVSVLPTVWSNCLAGWWLGGAGHTEHLPFIFGGATLLYVGGALLKDAFDVEFDREHRPSRPIPAGRVSEASVYRAGLVFLVIGALLLLWPGHLSGALGLFLVFLIILHNTTLRLVPIAPLLRGFCRLLLYMFGGAAAAHGIGGWTLWCGLALAAYSAGVGYLGFPQASPGSPRSWAVLPLAIPIALALIMDAGQYRESGLLLSAILFLWSVRSIRHLFWSVPPQHAGGIAGLTAGMIFVDWLATCPLNLPAPLGNGPRQLSFAFLALFALTLALQKLAAEKHPLPTVPASGSAKGPVGSSDFHS